MALNLKEWTQNLHDGIYDNASNARKSAGINAAKGSWPDKDKNRAMAAINDYFQVSSQEPPQEARKESKKANEAKKDKKDKNAKSPQKPSEKKGAGSVKVPRRGWVGIKDKVVVQEVGCPQLPEEGLIPRWGVTWSPSLPQELLLQRLAVDMKTLEFLGGALSPLIEEYRRIFRSLEEALLDREQEAARKLAEGKVTLEKEAVLWNASARGGAQLRVGGGVGDDPGGPPGHEAPADPGGAESL